MTDEEYRKNLSAIEKWANEQSEIIQYKAARPPDYSVDPRGHDEHRRIYRDWLQQVAAIEETMYFVADALDAFFFGQEMPEPKNEQQAAQLERFKATWI